MAKVQLSDRRRVLFGLILVITLTLCHEAFGTAQMSEWIWFEGTRQPLCSEPLQSLLDSLAVQPEVFNDGILSSANWRGYQGTWEIRHDSLWLIKIEKEYFEDEEHPDLDKTVWREIALESIYPEKTSPCLANWFSGLLPIPLGRMIKYVHMGYGSVFEQEIIIKVSHGIVTGVDTLSFHPEPLDFRCFDDIQRCGESVGTTRTGDWTDLRALYTTEGKSILDDSSMFTTRGKIVFGEPFAMLCIPATQMTDEVCIELDCQHLKTQPIEELFVEASGRLEVVDEFYRLIVDTIRELDNTESIHAVDYPDRQFRLEFWEPADENR